MILISLEPLLKLKIWLNESGIVHMEPWKITYYDFIKNFKD